MASKQFFTNILDQAVINLTYTVGEEKLAFVGFDFLFLLGRSAALGRPVQ